MRIWRSLLIFAVAYGVIQPSTQAQSVHAPSLSVHPSHYGIETEGKKRLSVESIVIKLHDRAAINAPYTVQCFFFKKPISPQTTPVIYDTVIFEVNSPRASYEVASEPIPLSSSKESSQKSKSKSKSKKKGKKAGKSAKGSNSAQRAADYPREGYLVRVLQNGLKVREQASSHALQQLEHDTPELFDKAASSKSTRRPESKDLIKN